MGSRTSHHRSHSLEECLELQQPKAYGGELMKTRAGRKGARPITTKLTMHLILRSSKAKGLQSFRRDEHDRRIRSLTARYSKRFGVRVLSLANVGNHLHFQIQLTNRQTYPRFIRVLTGAIAMAVTGAQHGRPMQKRVKSERFWDRRPYTRIVQSFRALLNLKDYLEINRLEGFGYSKEDARMLIKARNFSGDWLSGVG